MNRTWNRTGAICLLAIGMPALDLPAQSRPLPTPAAPTAPAAVAVPVAPAPEAAGAPAVAEPAFPVAPGLAPTASRARVPAQDPDDAVDQLRRAVARLQRAELSAQQRREAAQQLHVLMEVLHAQQPAGDDEPAAPRRAARARSEQQDVERVARSIRQRMEERRPAAEANDEEMARVHEHLLEAARALHGADTGARAHDEAARVHEHLLEAARALHGAETRAPVPVEVEEEAGAEDQPVARPRRPASRRAAVAAPVEPVPPHPTAEPPASPDVPRESAVRNAPRPRTAPPEEVDTDELRAMVDDLRAEMESLRRLLDQIRAHSGAPPRNTGAR